MMVIGMQSHWMKYHFDIIAPLTRGLFLCVVCIMHMDYSVNYDDMDSSDFMDYVDMYHDHDDYDESHESVTYYV